MPYFSLSDIFAVEIEGRDSAKYLHSRLSNDILHLGIGENRKAAALSPHGKALAVFVIYRLDTERFLAICDGGDPDATQHALFQYKVSEQLVAKQRKDFVCFHFAVENRGALERALNIEALDPDRVAVLPRYEELMLLPRKRSKHPGFDILVPKAFETELRELLSHLDSEWDPQTQLMERVLSNTPSFPSDIGSDRVFSEFQLKEAVSFNKGCYVGQEVIERVDSRGSAPRRLLRFECEGVPSCSAGEKIRIQADHQAWDGILLNVTKFPQQANYGFLLITNKAPELSTFELQGLAAKSL